jgi:hypothetical protein
MASDDSAKERLAVVARLVPGSRERAQEIIAAGPPYELGESGLAAHQIYLGEEAAVFVFEGPDVEALVSALISDPAGSGSFSAWGPLLAGTPMLAREEFSWEA